MINLRYHIVSITAVFLALGIGLTLGSTFLDRVTVDTLKAQLDDVEAQVERTNAENEELSARLRDLQERDDALVAALPERLLSGRLDDVPVLVVATDGTPQPTVDQSTQALEAAGADVMGSWLLTDRWLLDDEEEVSDLARLLDLSTQDVDRLRRNAAIRIAELLAAAAQPAVEDETMPDPGEPGERIEAPTTTTTTVPTEPGEPTEPDLISALEEAGFIEYQPAKGGDQAAVALPPAGARYLFISGTPAVEGPQMFAAALLDEMAAEGPVPVIAAQGPVDSGSDAEALSDDARRTTFVGPIRDGELTTEAITTIDDLDTAAGLVALVLAMEDLEVPTIGHYGVAPGASTLLPGPTTSP